MGNQKDRLLGIINEITSIKELREIPGVSEEASRFKERLTDEEFRVAVVGEFSSGKSTFINALLGKDILLHATTETTAAVTRIVNVEKDDPRRMTGVAVTGSGEQIPLRDLSALKDFTTTQSEKYQSVPDEIAAVEIYYPFFDANTPFVLIDTPGLNGVAEKHRELTIEIIQKAHACIYLIPRRGLSESDAYLLNYLTGLQKNFIFVQNFIDEFNEWEGDSVPEKLSEQRAVLDEKVFSEEYAWGYNICGISALMELAASDYEIDRLYADSAEPLTEEARIRLHEQSGFDEFKKIMAEMLRADRLDEIRYGGTARAVTVWITSLLEQINGRERRAKEAYDVSRAKFDIDKLEELREKITSNIERHKERLENFIIGRGDEIVGEERADLKESLADLNEKTAAEISGIQKLADLERYEDKLPNYLDGEIQKILKNEKSVFRLKFQEMYQLLLQRIDEYSGIKSSENLNLDLISISNRVERTKSFSQEQSRIDKMGKKLESEKREKMKLEDDGAQISSELRNAKEDEKSQKRAIKENDKFKDDSLSRQGSRPSARTRQQSYIAEEYRGGWGILDALFGPKKVTKYRTVRDDSAGKKWDEQRAKIINFHTERNNELEKELASTRRRKSSIESKLEANNEKIKSAEGEIGRLEELIAVEKERVETEKKRAEQEYLNMRKDSLKRQIKAYLADDSTVLNEAAGNMKKNAGDIERKFIKLANEQFAAAVNQKLKWIEQVKQEKSPEILKQAKHLGEIAGKLEEMRKEAEVC